MNRLYNLHPFHIKARPASRIFLSSPQTKLSLPVYKFSSSLSSQDKKCGPSQKQTPRATTNHHQQPLTLAFWSSSQGWKRAALNTFRCLFGCTLGDFSAFWMLQSSYGHWGMGAIMGVSMASGITTSIILETLLLHLGKDKLPWGPSFSTATGMSLVSMLAMETVQNLVDYHLTGGMVMLGDPKFWGAAVVSMGAGFLAPLPWNYWRLLRLGRSCH